MAKQSTGFADLLRRSKFATFDPQIRQAYGAPPSHIHRGQFGLKRPITPRRRNAYISLKNFEEHAQYIEWDNAEPQVRFIKRIEELNVTPDLTENTPWYLGLGAAATSRDSQMDSEFCPGEKGVGEMPKPQIQEEPSIPIDLDSLGKRGKGQYGIHAKPRPVPTETGRGGANFLQPNIHAMKPRTFDRYIEKIRTLRPQFEEYIRTVQSSDASSYPFPSPKTESTTISPENISQLTRRSLHMAFLGQHTQDQFSSTSSSDAICQQPHKYAGLTYHTPTKLESNYLAPTEPGLILQRKIHEDNPKHRSNKKSYQNQPFIASYAGLASELPAKWAGATGTVHPILDPNSKEGVQLVPSSGDGENPIQETISKSSKPLLLHSLSLSMPPKPVGSHSSPRLLTQTHLVSSVVSPPTLPDSSDPDQNPFKVGSREYNGLLPNDLLSGGRRGRTGAVVAGFAARAGTEGFWRSGPGAAGVPPIYAKKNRELGDRLRFASTPGEEGVEGGEGGSPKLTSTLRSLMEMSKGAGKKGGINWDTPLSDLDKEK